MKSLIYTIVLLGATACLGQQFSSQVFHEGFLVTTDRDTLKGKLQYDLETNILTMIHRGKTKSFSSQKVFYFEIFDSILNNYRQFYSIPFHVNYNYKIPVFFELIYEGKVSLLAREYLVNQSVNTTSAYWGGGAISQLVIRYNYYFMKANGDITFFSGKKKELLEYMRKKQSAVKGFIKDNKLDTDRMADLVRITAFYNSI